MRSLSPVLALLALSASLAACAAESNPVHDLAAEERAIRAVDQQLLNAARNLDAAAFAAAFAPDGQLLFPNGPAITGRDAIRERVQRDFAMPDFSVTWVVPSYTVAASGDMAWGTGTYRLRLTTPDGPVEDHGKALTVWRKIDGEWRIAADMINTSVPLPAPGE